MLNPKKKVLPALQFEASLKNFHRHKYCISGISVLFNIPLQSDLVARALPLDPRLGLI